MSFSKDFLFGAATAAAQIEGGWNLDGRGASIWDFVEPKEGCSLNGADARITCDHYNRWREDVSLMSEIGLQAYRFSISWSRLYPKGFGKLNAKGVEFYDNLINELIAKNIKPVITLYHWDMPEEVFQRGGWLNPDCAKWFSDYCAKVVELYSNRVDMFITLNEPECFIGCGYLLGEHAPFARLPFDRVLQITHRVLIANGQAVRSMRMAAKKPIRIGLAPAIWMFVPRTESAEDIEVARAKSFAYKKGLGGNFIAETALTGEYPSGFLAKFGSYFEHPESDMRLIHAPMDFFAFNNYSADIAGIGQGGEQEFHHDYNTIYTGMGWPVVPNSVYWMSRFLYERYGLPIYVTENGIATVDIPNEKGVVEDASRIAYTHKQLLGVERAISEGIPIKGYFHWALMDNFEWGYGFTKRFGLIYVDYNTKKRTLKKSAYWYRDLISSRTL